MEPTTTAGPRAAERGVLADPVKFISDLASGLEPGLEPNVIRSVVADIAGGPVKARKLARALSQRPALLTDGRSPAPRAIGVLLIALLRAGAVKVSAPVCADCHIPLQAMHYKGTNWYCGVCGPMLERCAGCGILSRVASRTRDGGPLCKRCPVGDGTAPIGIILQIVAAIDPGIGFGVVRTAILAAAPQTVQRLRLARALQAQPGLLTGDGAQAPVPAVLRLIELLCQAGAEHILRPPCPQCGRILPLVKNHNRLRLCAHCASSDPAHHENCHRCGRLRRVNMRTPEGPVCLSCNPAKILTCSICATTGPARISKTTGKPWCRACSKITDKCTGCGQVKKIYGGTRGAPLCGACTRPDPAFWRECPGCGEPGCITVGRCARCTTQRRLQELLGDGHGNIRPDLHNLYQELAATERITTVAGWLNKSGAPTILGTLDSGTPLTHQALDELAGETTLAGDKTTEHLRAVLVATGTLPARDEQIARLERWISRLIAEQPDPAQGQLVHRYAIWHQLRRLRGRLRGADATYGQIRVIKQNTTGATRFLDWLTGCGLTLESAGQGDLEAWYISKDATLRAETGNFIRWANANKLTTLHFHAEKWGGPSTAIDTEERWADARRLLQDTTLKPEDRVVGLLLILYAQRLSSISRLKVDDVHVEADRVLLRLGREPVVLPEPLGVLIRQVMADLPLHTARGARESSPWLFPGGRPGQAITPSQLGVRLKKLGIRPGQARSTALFQLAIDLPAALMARMLGIHIGVAVQWQRASSGDWTNYAADVSRRNQP